METANPNSLLVTYFLVQRAKYKYLYPNYHILYIKYKVVFFFKEFQLMASAHDDNSLSSD